MLYYRVKPDMDNRPLYKFVGNTTKVKRDGILIANELYTPAERKQIANADKFFEKVEISQRKTYWFFGARFSDETGVVIE
jgi:hypothetical protein